MSQSTGLTDKILKFLNLDRECFKALEAFLRKLAHFSLFALLGMSVFYALCGHEIKITTAFLLGICICLIYAISDELHQGLVPGRAPQITDVFIDFSGSLFGSVAGIVIYKINNAGRNK